MQIHMKTSTFNSGPLLVLIRHQQEEVAKYKWIESKKAGQDIGWERAAAEWLERHFPDWERDQHSRAIDEALHALPTRRRTHSGQN